ncbi:MAG: tetratricopeptide repeat protein [Proteobacteria bacterium]|nr:tetratricopeptide repeat protein [Pseudomonadota bacterium]
MQKLGWLAALIAAWVCSTTIALAAERGCVPPPYAPGEVPSVIAACTGLLQSAADDDERAAILVLRGRAYKWVKQLDRAAFDMEEAIKRAPNEPQIYVWRGWVAYDQQIYNYAAALAEKALSLRAEYSPAYDLLGTVGSQTGNLAMARDAYNKAVAADPGNFHARENRLRLYRSAGAQREELHELEAMLALNSSELDRSPREMHHRLVPLRIYLRVERAELLKAMGRADDSAKAYDELVADHPGAMSYGLRAEFRHLKGDDAGALEDIEAGLKADDSFAFLHQEKGFILNTAKRYDEAAAAFTRALTLYPTEGAALWGRAVARRALGDIKPSIADAQMALIVDARFFRYKFRGLVNRGYLLEAVEESDRLAAVKDAAQACMIDKACL